MPSPKPSPSPVALPEDLVAVCLDANCMGEGRLKLSAIEKLGALIDEQDLDVDIWVPEPVLWEWAEHLHSQFDTARTGYLSAWEALKRGGWTVPQELPNLGPAQVEDTLTGLREALEAIECTVLDLSSYPQIAANALRDQTLLTGVGRRKSTVKAGAADSASFRLLDAALKETGGPRTVALVSADQDARTFFTQRPDVVIVPSVWDLQRSVTAMRNGSEIAADQARQAMRELLPQLSPWILEDTPIEGSPELRAGSRLTGHEVASTLRLESVDSVVDIEFIDVSVRDDYAIAEVDALVTVERGMQVLSAVNDQIEYDVESFDGVRGRLQVSAMRGPQAWSVEVEEIHF